MEEGKLIDTNKFDKLKQLADSSYNAIRSQINNIYNDKAGSSFRWLITLVISLGLPALYSHFSLLNISQIILTWVPISFILFLVISLFSIFGILKKYSTYRRLTEDDWIVMKQATEEHVKYVMQRDWGKSLAPLLYSMILIFIFSLMILLGVIFGVISSNNHGNLILPILITLVMVLDGIGGVKFGSASNKSSSTSSIVHRGVLTFYSAERSLTGSMFVFSVILCSILLILPFSLAIWLTEGMIENLLLFFIVFASQILFFLTISSILSRDFAIKYLEDAAGIYQKISEEIGLVLLNKVNTKVEYDKLETKYLQAKKYSIRRDLSLFLFVFYIYDPDIKYLKTNPEFNK